MNGIFGNVQNVEMNPEGEYIMVPSDHVNYGWKKLVDELHERVLEIDPDVKVEQVKEKFGGLRYYFQSFSPRYEEIDKLVSFFEVESYKTCEVCGKAGKPRNDRYWINTLCDEHALGDEPAWEKANIYKEGLNDTV